MDIKQGILIKIPYDGHNIGYFFPNHKNRTEKAAAFAVNHYAKLKKVDKNQKDFDIIIKNTIKSFYDRMRHIKDIEIESHYKYYTFYDNDNSNYILDDKDILAIYNINKDDFDIITIITNKEPKKIKLDCIINDDIIQISTSSTSFINIYKIPKIDIDNIYNNIKELSKKAKEHNYKILGKKALIDKLKELELIYNNHYNNYLTDYNSIKKEVQPVQEKGYFLAGQVDKFIYNYYKTSFKKIDLEVLEKIKSINYLINDNIRHLKNINNDNISGKIYLRV